MDDRQIIKVIYIARAPFISGAERCLQLILKNAAFAGLYPVLVTPKDSPLKDWAITHSIKHYNLAMDPLTARSKMQWIFSQIKFTAICLLEKPRAIHSNQIWSYPIVSLASKVLNITTVCHFRDQVDNGSRWWINKRVDHGISISRYIEKQAKEHLTSLVSRHHRLVDPVEVASLIDELPKKTDRRIITFGFIGQITPVKGLLELLEELATHKNRNWMLVVAGEDSSQNQEYINHCKDVVIDNALKEHVEFIGFIDDTDAFYRKIDIVLVPSLEEPLGLIPLEAAMRAKPAIAMNIGGLPETIINNKTGWICNSHSKLVEKALDISKEEASLIGIYASEHVRSLCDVSNHLVKLRSIYISER